MRLRLLCAALVVAVTALVTPTASAAPFYVWRWVDCGPMTVSTEIHNLDTSGYRYQVKNWFYDAAGNTRRVDTADPWVSGKAYKVSVAPVQAADESIRTKVTRGHYEIRNGWQVWVIDQQLMDTTTPAC
jgi:hypothetical protein